jgi:hypothetical protein
MSSDNGRLEWFYRSGPDYDIRFPGFLSVRLPPKHQQFMQFWWPPIRAARTENNVDWYVDVSYPTLVLLFAIAPATLPLRSWWRRRRKSAAFPIEPSEQTQARL